MLRQLSPKDPKEQEQMFQQAMAHWSEFHDQESYNEMWARVQEACKALALKIAPGKPHIIERSLDAAIVVMQGIVERGLRPRKLSSYCYWPCRGQLQGKLAQQEDGELQLADQYEEQTQDKVGYDNVRGIYRPEMNGGKEIE